MIRIEHNGSSSINNYIDDCDAVPGMTEKNRDGTLVISEFQFIINDNYTTVITEGDEIIVYDNQVTSYGFFIGEITEVNPDFENNQKYITVRSILYKLAEKKINYSNLNAAFRSTVNLNEYISSDNFSLPNVQVLWAIKSMMTTAGNEFNNFTVATELETKIIKTISYLGNFYGMKISHLVMDENVLYALNQLYAINQTGINNDLGKVRSQLTYFDFISEFCSHFGAHLRLSTSGFPNIFVLDLAGTPTPGSLDDYTYDKSEQLIPGDALGYYHNLMFSTDRNDYADLNESALAEHKVNGGAGGNNIQTYNNWIYMFRKTSSMGGNNGDVLGHAYPSLCYEADLYLQKKIDAITADIKETTILTNLASGSALRSERIAAIDEIETTWAVKQ